MTAGVHKKLEEIELKGVLAERVRPDGKRALSLRKAERLALQRQRMIEQAVALFLDIDHEHSWKEIAQTCGISVQTLKDMTKSDDFMEQYGQHFADLGHDPRLKAAQSAIGDLVPLAVRELGKMIRGATPATVKLSAIKEVIRLAGIEQPKVAQSDKQELFEFLKASGINIGQMNMTLPPEYLRALQEMPVEGEVVDVTDQKRLAAASRQHSDDEPSEATEV